MRSIFLKNLILSQGLNLIIKPMWLLVIDRMAQNLLGNSYGEYYIVLNFTLIFNIVLDIGIQNFNNTHVASNSSFFRSNLKQLLILKLGLSFLYLILIFGIAYFKNLPIQLLILLSLSQVLTSFTLFFRSNINGLHHYKIDSYLSVSDKFFSILICLAFYGFNKINIYYFALAQLIGVSISFFIALFFNLKFFKESISEVTNSISIKELLNKSKPYALLFALMGFYTRADVLLMDYFLKDSSYHTAIYAQSYRLLDASSMFAMLFAGLLLPMFSKQISKKEDVRPLTQTAATILVLITIVISSASFLFNESIMRFLTNYKDIAQIEYVSNVFKIVMLCFIPMGFIFIFSTLLTASKDITFMIYAATVSLICNLILNSLLIPQYQAFGAAISALITQSLFAIFCIVRCYKIFNFKISFLHLGKYLVFIVALIGVFVLIKGLTNLWLILSLYIAASVVLAILLKIINVNKFLSFFMFDKQ